MSKTFSVSGQHYLFDVQTFAHTVLAAGGDEYSYALRDRTTQGVIDDVAQGVSELGILLKTSASDAALDEAFKAAGVRYTARGPALEPPDVECEVAYVGRSYRLAVYLF